MSRSQARLPSVLTRVCAAPGTAYDSVDSDHWRSLVHNGHLAEEHFGDPTGHAGERRRALGGFHIDLLGLVEVAIVTDRPNKLIARLVDVSEQHLKPVLLAGWQYGGPPLD